MLDISRLGDDTTVLRRYSGSASKSWPGRNFRQLSGSRIVQVLNFTHPGV